MVPCPLFRHLIHYQKIFYWNQNILCCLIKFQGNLDLEQFIEIEKWDGGVHLSLSGQDLKFDQNIGRYYFNFPAPCSLPILFSAAWCNNKCYLDQYLVRGRNGSAGPGLMIHLSDRLWTISWRCLWDFLSESEPGQSWVLSRDLSVCDDELWGSIWLSPAQHGDIFSLVLWPNCKTSKNMKILGIILDIPRYRDKTWTGTWTGCVNIPGGISKYSF